MQALVEVEKLKKYFLVGGLFARGNKVHAVDGVTFQIREKETMGLVGESGCGKTTTGRLILGLTKPTSGTVRFRGRDIFSLSKKEMRNLRSEMQMIFQDPYGSLNPRKSVHQILSRPYKIHHIVSEDKIESKISELLEITNLTPPSFFMDKYPHELSGGERQRVALARAISLRPTLIVADEAVAFLDVSVKGKILNLMKELQNKFGLTYLYITHDLAVLRSMADRIAVMYLGKIVEIAEVEEFYKNPLHPYSQGLLSAVPIPDPKKTRTSSRITLGGEVPSPINPPSGCRFNTRGRYRKEICVRKQPQLVNVGCNHFVRCHLYN